MRVIGVDLLAAVGALKHIISGIYPADADFGLDVPALVENPRITIGDTRSGHPALESVLLEFTEVCAEKFKRHIEVAIVILPAQQMRTDEMARICLAKPVASLRLYKPVLPAVVLDGPRIQVRAQVACPLWSKFYLYTAIQRGCRIVE